MKSSRRVRTRLRQGVWLVLLSVWPGWVWSADTRAPLERLQTFLDGLQRIDADFVQKVADPADGKTTEYRGRFTAMRPNLFRWDYTKPYTQLIVSDGQLIWHYEPDLLQVTRTAANKLEKTPAGFLITGQRIEETFDWKAVPDPDWHTPAVVLTPRQPDSTFQEIAVTLDAQGERMRSMVVVDNLGNRSHFSFQDMRHARAMNAQEFRFTPPAGVDVVTE